MLALDVAVKRAFPISSSGVRGAATSSLQNVVSLFGACVAIRARTAASSAAIRKSRAAFKGRLMFGSSEPLSNVINLMQCGHWV